MPPSKRPSRPPRPARRVSRAAATAIDYRNPESLRPFLTDVGKIRPRRATGLSRRDQARLAQAVKRARELALVPYVVNAPEVRRGRRDG